MILLSAVEMLPQEIPTSVPEFVGQPTGPNWTVLIPMLIGVVFWAFVIICLVRVSRYFRNAGKEQKLIRMELGKLAEEVKQVRQVLKNEGSE